MSRHDRAVLKKPDGESLDLQQTEIDAPALPIEQMEKAEKFRPEINTWLMEQTAREAEDRRKRQHRIDTFVFIGRAVPSPESRSALWPSHSSGAKNNRGKLHRFPESARFFSIKPIISRRRRSWSGWAGLR